MSSSPRSAHGVVCPRGAGITGRRCAPAWPRERARAHHPARSGLSTVREPAVTLAEQARVPSSRRARTAPRRRCPVALGIACAQRSFSWNDGGILMSVTTTSGTCSAAVSSNDGARRPPPRPRCLCRSRAALGHLRELDVVLAKTTGCSCRVPRLLETPCTIRAMIRVVCAEDNYPSVRVQLRSWQPPIIELVGTATTSTNCRRGRAHPTPS
jgi:hypothetical protein